MRNLFHHELKKEFQLERMILFSDAVIAIAITLLVIEIKIPELHDEFTDGAFLHDLKLLVPKFVGFLISFIFIGLFWSIHHRIFGFVINYSRRLIFLNLAFLFSIALMPFSNGIYGEYSGPRTVNMTSPVIIYNLNIIFTALMSLLIWLYVCNPRNKVSEDIPEIIRKNFKRRLIIIVAVFLLSMIVALFNPVLARYIYIIIPVIMRIATKKLPKEALNS